MSSNNSPKEALFPFQTLTPSHLTVDPERHLLTAAHQFAIDVIGEEDGRYIDLFWSAFHLAVAHAPAAGSLRSAGSPLPVPLTVSRSPATAAEHVEASQKNRSLLLQDQEFVRNETQRIRAGLHRFEITGGSDDPTNLLPDCVAVGINGPNGFTFVGSGTLITPHVVLTAAHCLAAQEQEMTIYTGPNINSAPGTFIPGAGHQHPQFDNTLLSSSPHDIAVIILNQAVGIPPRPVAPTPLLTGASQALIAGYGANDPFGSVNAGVRRYGYVSLGNKLATEMVAGPSNVPGHTGDACRGDSGGPLYVGDGTRWFIAGVTSRTLPGNHPHCGYGHIYTRIDAHWDFVSAYL